MAQPPAYNRTHDFTLDEKGDVDTASLNAEYDNVALTVNKIRECLALLQNDDGSLRAGVIKGDAIGKELTKKIDELVNEALKQAQTAVEAANKAANSATEAVDDVTEEGTKQLEAVRAEGTGQIENVSAELTQVSNDEQAKIVAEGSRQVSRVESAGAGLIDNAKGYAEAAAASATDAKGNADAAAKSFENAAAVESRVNAKEANLSAGLTQVSNDEQAKIIAEGNRQVSRVESAGAGLTDKVNVTGQYQVDRITAEGDKQINRVGVRGDSEVARLNRVGEIVLDRSGLRCKAGTRTFDAAIAAGVEVTLPAGISYAVAAKHLRLSWNGLVLYPGEQYTEVGTEFTESTAVKFTFDLRAGDVLQAWVIPLGGTKDSETGVITPDASKKCAVETWTISGAAAAPVVLRLPNGMTYVAGKDHLRMSWNGLVLMQPYEYEEVGEAGASSNQIKLNLGLRAGDVLNAWTVPYASGEPSETQYRGD